LKEKVRQWLAQRSEVLAFCQAPVNLGGSGALLVLLKA
jgi:DNA-nicking Smr family endonuclease